MSLRSRWSGRVRGSSSPTQAGCSARARIRCTHWCSNAADERSATPISLCSLWMAAKDLSAAIARSLRLFARRGSRRCSRSTRSMTSARAAAHSKCINSGSIRFSRSRPNMVTAWATCSTRSCARCPHRDHRRHRSPLRSRSRSSGVRMQASPRWSIGCFARSG